MLLTVLVCMVLTQATPAQAKKHSKGKGNTYGTKVISIESFAKEADSDSRRRNGAPERRGPGTISFVQKEEKMQYPVYRRFADNENRICDQR